MSKKVLVLYGGWSAEREVSLESGTACATGLESSGYQVSLLDANLSASDLVTAIQSENPDVIFNALHGRWGEDGTVQGILEYLQIPYTHSGVLASSLAMDKILSKKVFAAAGIPVAHSIEVTPEELQSGDPLPRPFVIKPLNEGSSVGVRLVFAGDNDPLWIDDSGVSQRLMAENFIAGREFTVAVMDDQALAVTEIRPKHGFYDYKAKYNDDFAAEHIIPAPIDPELEALAMDYAVRAHRALNCRGATRADFRYDEDGDKRLYILEVNTQPGMTKLSLVPEQANFKGISFPQLVSWMVENAQCDA